jgi:hypothetical protein
MLSIAIVLEKVISPFACLFTKPTWKKLQVLLMGAILSPRKRTVTAALRVMGLADQNDFAKYHQVLNRAVWSGFKASRILLKLLLKSFDQGGPLVFGLDETLERRWGKKIKAKGIYRDSVRSSHSHFVKCSGLRWISLMWLTPIPWAKRVWALPVLTALAPSERYCKEQDIRHKKVTDWARQIIMLLRRWLPDRDIVLVADSGYSALDLLHAAQSLAKPITMITRLRLDAALFKPAPPRKKGQLGRPRRKGERLPTLAARLKDPKTNWQRHKVTWYDQKPRVIEIASDTAIWFHYGKKPVPIRWLLIRDPKGSFEPQALLSINRDVEPLQMLNYFILRWTMEVTFQEARAQLGVETNRQFSDLAIARTTPLLFALFSVVTLAAHESVQLQELSIRRTSWYCKTYPTFSDALATVRQRLWLAPRLFDRSSCRHDIIKLPKLLYERFIDTLSYAA